MAKRVLREKCSKTSKIDYHHCKLIGSGKCRIYTSTMHPHHYVSLKSKMLREKK